VLQIDGPPAPETLRHDQLARRQRIVRTALRALANSDYDQVKISEVARDSGVALGTLYRYFASKEHLFAAAFVEWQGALKKKLEKERPHGESEAERLRDVFHQTIRYAADLYQSVSSQFHDAVQMAFTGPFDTDHDAIYGTVNSVLDGSMRSWVMNRATIADVYRNVDNAIRLIYEYSPQ
jgi:TetR/AcrR family transcriptional regulator, cholesterol catabolism regulator